MSKSRNFGGDRFDSRARRSANADRRDKLRNAEVREAQGDYDHPLIVRSQKPKDKRIWL